MGTQSPLFPVSDSATEEKEKESSNAAALYCCGGFGAVRPAGGRRRSGIRAAGSPAGISCPCALLGALWPRIAFCCHENSACCPRSERPGDRQRVR